MANIGKYIYPELILTNLPGSTKEEAIRLLLNKIFEINPDCAGNISRENAYQELITREKLQTTGIGQGLAFPHARIKGWSNFVLAIGICEQGIDFNSLDKKLARFICLMISAQEAPYMILQTMASVIRFINDSKSIETLFQDMNSQEISDRFHKFDMETTKVIFARDIMRPVKTSVNLNTTVEEAARIMHLNHLDTLPVVDEQNHLCGQISCFDIFTYGIPNFFKQLLTVSFVRHIDPFEKYFKIQKDLKVKDLFQKECATITQEATLLEIIFLLAVKNETKIFVVDKQNLVGEIDRFSIIDKILFF